MYGYSNLFLVLFTKITVQLDQNKIWNLPQSDFKYPSDLGKSVKFRFRICHLPLRNARKCPEVKENETEKLSNLCSLISYLE